MDKIWQVQVKTDINKGTKYKTSHLYKVQVHSSEGGQQCMPSQLLQQPAPAVHSRQHLFCPNWVTHPLLPPHSGAPAGFRHLPVNSMSRNPRGQIPVNLSRGTTETSLSFTESWLPPLQI
ncbi:uncharacterized protein LOC119515355 isoform X3 [Choloepus didactylus]|uniref:uncharacterized protein LOC119515355 isoform X3 n=1 Tax=Choloepus didactylus TaxID=27675 RepID=UPI0018A10F6F|nr:uncharacterized protein LOC119515355 isoform X3 [Choloepus didactylus]